MSWRRTRWPSSEWTCPRRAASPASDPALGSETTSKSKCMQCVHCFLPSSTYFQHYTHTWAPGFSHAAPPHPPMCDYPCFAEPRQPDYALHTHVGMGGKDTVTPLLKGKVRLPPPAGHSIDPPLAKKIYFLTPLLSREIFFLVYIKITKNLPQKCKITVHNFRKKHYFCKSACFWSFL